MIFFITNCWNKIVNVFNCKLKQLHYLITFIIHITDKIIVKRNMCTKYTFENFHVYS